MTGRELRNWRTRAGLTQADLARRLGFTSNTIARWERDEMSIPAHVNPAAINQTPQEYIQRIMRENKLTHREVAERASKRGHRVSAATIQMMVRNESSNPGIYTVQALAVGLGRPEEEVFAAFGVCKQNVSFRVSEFEAIQQNYGCLSPQQQRQVDPVIKMLSREIQRLLSE